MFLFLPHGMLCMNSNQSYSFGSPLQWYIKYPESFLNIWIICIYSQVSDSDEVLTF